MRTHRSKSICRVAVTVAVAASVWIAGPTIAATSQSESPASHAKSKSEFETNYPAASALSKVIGRAADAALDIAASDPMTAQPQADAAFLLACAYGSSQDTDAFRESDFTSRLIKQLADAPDANRSDLLSYLRAHPALAHTLVFAIKDGMTYPPSTRCSTGSAVSGPRSWSDFPSWLPHYASYDLIHIADGASAVSRRPTRSTCSTST